MDQNERNKEKQYNEIDLTAELIPDIFDLLTVGALLIDRDDGVILANTKAATYLGTPRERLLEDGLRRDDASSGEKYLDKITENVIRSGHSFSQDDIALIIADDIVSYFSIRIKPLVSSRELALVTLEDVSEKIETGKNLDEAQARIVKVVTYLPDPIFIIEEDGTISFFSYRDNIAFGYELPAFTGEKLAGLFADGVSAGEDFLAALKETKEIEGYETQILDNNGSPVNVSISAMNIADPEIGNDAYIGTIRDITESVLRTDELTALKDFSENILDNIEVGIIVVDTDYNIIRWSYGQEMESGIVEADVLGMNVLDLLPNLKEEKAGRLTIEERARDVMRTGQPFRVERFLHQDRFGQYEILDLRLSPLRDNTGMIIGLVIINDNISEKVNLQREVEEKTIRLEVERNRLVDLFDFTNKLRELDEIEGKIDLIIGQLNDLGWACVYCTLLGNDIIRETFGSVGFNDTEIETLDRIFNLEEGIPSFDRLEAISANCYVIPKKAPAGDTDNNTGFLEIYQTGFFDECKRDLLLILLRNSRNEVLGITVLRRSTGYQEIKEEVLTALDLLASSVSLIIDEFQTRMLIENRNRGLRAITRISRNLNSVMSVEEPFNEVLNELKGLIGFVIGAIIYEDNGQYKYVTVGKTDNNKSIGFPAEATNDVFNGVIAGKDPVLFADMSSDSGFSGIGTGSALCVPIVYDDEGYGCIFLNDRRIGFFSEYDLELVTLIADHAAFALQNTKYFREEKLRVKQLSVMFKTGRLAASMLNVDELFNFVVSTLYSPDRYQYVSIAYLDKANQRLNVYFYKGPGDEKPKRIPYTQPIEIGAVGEAARTGKIVYIPDSEEDKKYESVDFIPSMYSEIAVPISIEGDVYAVLNVENSERNAFNETDIASLGALSAQIAVAIRNITLVARLREQSEELIKANEELTRFGQLREEFVSMLVHDMRTPLTGIIGSVEIIDEFIDEQVNDQIKLLMGIISKEARRMADLINDIRDFYRLLPGEIGLNPEPVALNDLIIEVSKINEKIAVGTGVSVEVIECTDLPVIICDRSKISLALSNVLKAVISNCDIDGNVTVEAESTGSGSVRISYRYECSGNLDGEVKHFFDSIDSDVPSYTNLSKSSNLGLSIAETIIDAHWGKFGMNCLGEGKSEIYVEIPIIES